MANENMDMKRMQEEAIHRVQEMQNRPNQQLRGTPPFAHSTKNKSFKQRTVFFKWNSRKSYRKSPLTTHQMNKAVLYMGITGILRQTSLLVPAGPQNIVENLLDGVMKDSERTLIYDTAAGAV